MGKSISWTTPEKDKNYHLPCLENSDTPWLLSTRRSNRKRVQVFCSISGANTSSRHKNIPQLRKKSILASIHDCLILRDSVRPELFSIFNLFTLHTLPLPPLHPLPDADDDILCGLNSSPDDNTHHCVLLIFFTEANLMYSCRPTDPNCSWLARPFQLHGSDSKLSELFTLNGVMYVSTNNCISKKLFYCVDEIESSSSLILRPLQIREPDVIEALFTMPFFLESCNRVYLVAVSSYSVNNLDLEHVRVFELDFVECCWKKINTLNGRSFFVGFESCTWCWGTTDEFGSGGILRDSVYIDCPSVTRLPLNVYNLHHGSLLPLRPCQNNTLSYKQHAAVWVIPQQLRSEPMIRPRAVQTTECQDLESKFNILPLHLVEKISQHMHLFEYCNFRATSKTFRSICPAPRWKTNNVLPLLLHFDNGGSRRLIDPCRQGSVSHVVPFFPDPSVIRYSKNGWVLALVGMSLQYFNLFTGVKGEYPKPHDQRKDDIFFFMKGIAFSTYPTCSECLTIGTLGNDDGAIIVYHESGKETWNYHVHVFEFEGGTSKFWPSTSCPIFLAGAFYILGAQGHLCVFQLVNGEGSCRTYAKPQTLKNNFSASHLVESEGQLYSVFIEKMGQCVQIFRFDNAIKSWVGVVSLENHVFFISTASSFSVVTRDRRMRNRIYLPRLYKKGVVFYCQDTKKYHSSTSDDLIDYYFGTYELLHCCWI